jgi:hypothetical protein
VRAETHLKAHTNVGEAVEQAVRPLVRQVLFEIQIRRSPELHAVHIGLHFHNLNYY